MLSVTHPDSQVFNQQTWYDNVALLSNIEKTFAKSGMTVYYVDAEGNKQKVIINQKIISPPKGASLQVEYEVTLQEAFYGVLADILSNRSDKLELIDVLAPLKTMYGKELTP